MTIIFNPITVFPLTPFPYRHTVCDKVVSESFSLMSITSIIVVLKIAIPTVFRFTITLPKQLNQLFSHSSILLLTIVHRLLIPFSVLTQVDRKELAVIPMVLAAASAGNSKQTISSVLLS
jgi:hypothetical protein